jgi:hypothetical protein
LRDDDVPLLVIGRDGPEHIVARADFTRPAGQAGGLAVLAALDGQLDDLLRPYEAEAWRWLEPDRRAEIEDLVDRAHDRSEELHRLAYLTLRERFDLIRALDLASRFDVDLGTREDHVEITAVRNAIAHGQEPRGGTEVIHALQLAEGLLDLVADIIDRRRQAADAVPLPAGGPISAERPTGLAKRITRTFLSGELDLSRRRSAPVPGWGGMPEVAAAARVTAAGADGPRLRSFLTLTMAMDRARESDRLWSAAAALFEREPWVFAPAEIIEKSDRVPGLLSKFGVTQRHTQDSRAWLRIADTLVNAERAPAVVAAIDDGAAAAGDLLAEVQSSHTGAPLFPLLRGPKIAPVWVRVLAYPGMAAISGIEGLPVAVDVQVVRISRLLGVADVSGCSDSEARRIVQARWAEDLEAGGADGPPGLENTAAALDPALWFYAKWGCSFCEAAGVRMPIGEPCGACRLGAE